MRRSCALGTPKSCVDLAMKYHHSALSFDIEHARSVLAVSRAAERLGADLQKGEIPASGVKDAREVLVAVMEESARVERASIPDAEARSAQSSLAKLYLDLGTSEVGFINKNLRLLCTAA